MLPWCPRPRNFRTLFTCTAAFLLVQFLPAAACGQHRPPLVTGKIDETRRIALPGNVRAEANPRNDLGAVGDSMRFDHLQLVLQRPAALEAALDSYLQQAQTPGNPNYLHWLTAEQLGVQYGPAPADIAAVRGWLEAHGFQVNSVSASGMLMDFSGTAAQIAGAFRTEIHALSIHGERHFANISDPQVPAALAPVIAGVAALHNFRPHPLVKPLSKATGLAPVRPNYTVGPYTQIVTPADLATIYNFNPAYSRGITGNGQTVVVLEDSDLYSNADYSTFRSTLLPAAPQMPLQVVHPGGCADPGVQVGGDFEATLDAEWAAAAAPGAQIVVASCADTATNFGGFVALQSLIESHHPPAIVSVSYGECESALGAAGNRYIATLYQIAAAEGISIYAGSGDSGAASCDAYQAAAQQGIAVNGYASTPYNLAAGGTDFSDTYYGTNSNYWSPNNTSQYGSALGYVPEMTWNDSCASAAIYTDYGYSAAYGSSGFCNSAIGQYYWDAAAAGGGPSGCAYGNAGTTAGTAAVSGTCHGYAKPLWQRFIAGNPHDHVRDLPDVSMFAANGLWGHYFVLCYSDPAYYGVPCSGPPSGWSGGGGTSFSAPVLAGVQALVNQKTRSRQGNPGYMYYALATRQYGSTGNPACDASNGAGVCIFHDITLGSSTVDCVGAFNCYDPSGQVGVLSVTSGVDAEAYSAAPGWDFASGIGSVNVTALVNAWAGLNFSEVTKTR